MYVHVRKNEEGEGGACPEMPKCGYLFAKGGLVTNFARGCFGVFAFLVFFETPLSAQIDPQLPVQTPVGEGEVHAAHFALKGTQSKRSVTRVRNKRLDVKKHAPGFGRCDFSLASGSRGGN